MFGNICKSVIIVYESPWALPALVGLLGCGLILFHAFRCRRIWKETLLWCTTLSLLMFAAWRWRIHADHGRYFLIFAIPSLILCIGAVRSVFLHNRPLQYLALSVIFVIALVRSTIFDPADRKIMVLYRNVHDDAAKISGAAGVSYTTHYERERFYSGVDVGSVDYFAPYDVVIKQLDGNFRVWDGDQEAVYIFLSLPRGATIPAQWLADNKVTVLGERWYDRRHRKRLTVLKYLPSPTRDAECVGELLPNGDFRAVLPDAENRKTVQQLGRRAKRFLEPGIILPQKWGIYHALTVKTDSVATVVRNGEKSALRMEAKDGYLAAISPFFQVPAPRKLGFEAYVETGAVLQLIREIRFPGRGGNMYTILTLKLAPGTRRRYIITLPPFERDVQSRVWFWLNSGTMELSDVRLQ